MPEVGASGAGKRNSMGEFRLEGRAIMLARAVELGVTVILLIVLAQVAWALIFR